MATALTSLQSAVGLIRSPPSESHHHTVTPSHYYAITLSHRHTITLLRYHTITPSHYYAITPSHYYAITPSHYYAITSSHHHIVTPSHRHTITSSHYYTIPYPPPESKATPTNLPLSQQVTAYIELVHTLSALGDQVCDPIVGVAHLLPRPQDQAASIMQETTKKFTGTSEEAR